MLANQITFNKNNLEQWANFSNDRNPIHFDLAVAKRLNFENIVAHGKLAILPVKAKISETLDNQEDWLHFKAIFRSPVICQRKLNIKLIQKTSRTTFNLSDELTQESYIKGSISVGKPKKINHVMLSDTISTTRLINDLATFKTAFSDYDYDWIIIDSLLFSHIIDKHFNTIINHHAGTKTIDIKSESKTNHSHNLIIQTSQETTFSKTLLGQNFIKSTLENKIFNYQIGDIESYHDNGKFVCSIDIAININNQNVMLTRYGFILI